MNHTGRRGEILLTIFDNGGPITSKEIRKQLKLSSSTVGNTLFSAKRGGFIENIGYAKWQLTERGKREVASIIPEQVIEHNGLKNEPIDYPHQPLPPINNPTTVRPTSEPIDWCREYIVLANKMVDALVHKQIP